MKIGSPKKSGTNAIESEIRFLAIVTDKVQVYLRKKSNYLVLRSEASDHIIKTNLYFTEFITLNRLNDVLIFLTGKECSMITVIVSECQ